jgi:hypothetical protein
MIRCVHASRTRPTASTARPGPRRRRPGAGGGSPRSNPLPTRATGGRSRSPGRWSSVVRAPARARPRAACVRPTDAPGRAAAASDRVALNRLTRRQVRAIRGAASAAALRPGRGSRPGRRAPPAPPVPPVEFIPAPCVCDSDCSQAPSHTLDGRRTITHAHDSRDTFAYSTGNTVARLPAGGCTFLHTVL